jgi:hypothetical protein
MTRPAPASLERSLTKFVAAHRGLRLSRAFGRTAAFAGRRMFARVAPEGLWCRLPDAALRRELSSGTWRGSGRARPAAAPAGRRGWIVYGVPGGSIGPDLSRVLEEAARYAALQSVGEALG